jgi:hypothetical protein
MEPIAAAALAGLSLVAILLARRVRALGAALADVNERVGELAARLEATEHDVAGALARTEVAETVLLEKGLADEEDLEAARRRFGAEAPPADHPRDGELH